MLPTAAGPGRGVSYHPWGLLVITTEVVMLCRIHKDYGKRERPWTREQGWHSRARISARLP